MVSITVKLGFMCPECSGPVPLGGLVATTRCERCQSTVPVDWKKLLHLGNPSLSVARWALERPQQEREKGGYAHIQLDIARALPRCACGVTWDAVALAHAAGQGMTCVCPGCQRPIAARIVPDHVRRHYPELVIAVGETMTAEGGSPGSAGGGGVAPLNDASENTAAVKPVLFACMNCGAPLRIDGTQRLVDCASCEAPNYLPDGLWLRLHPARKRETFFLLVQG
jgi:hypothetical protein